MNKYLYLAIKKLCKKSSTIYKYEPDYEKIDKFIVLTDGTIIPCILPFVEDMVDCIKNNKLIPNFNRYECLCISRTYIYMYRESKNKLQPNATQLAACYNALSKITSTEEASRHIKFYIKRYFPSCKKTFCTPIKDLEKVYGCEKSRVLAIDDNQSFCLIGKFIGCNMDGMFIVNDCHKRILCNFMWVLPPESNRVDSSSQRKIL